MGRVAKRSKRRWQTTRIYAQSKFKKTIKLVFEIIFHNLKLIIKLTLVEELKET